MRDDRTSDNQEREQAILDAAKRLLLHYGFDKTTVSDIAREAGISKGAIYLHFSSKDELFEALLWRESFDYAAAILERLDADTEPWDFVRMYQHALLIIAESPLLQSILRNDQRVWGNFMLRNTDKFVRAKRPFQQEFLRAMQAAGAIRDDIDPVLVGHVMSAFSYGLMAVGEYIEDAPPAEDAVMVIAEMLQRYITPEDGGNQEAGRELLRQMVEAFRAQVQGQKQAIQASNEE